MQRHATCAVVYGSEKLSFLADTFHRSWYVRVWRHSGSFRNNYPMICVSSDRCGVRLSVDVIRNGRGVCGIRNLIDYFNWFGVPGQEHRLCEETFLMRLSMNDLPNNRSTARLLTSSNHTCMCRFSVCKCNRIIPPELVGRCFALLSFKKFWRITCDVQAGCKNNLLGMFGLASVLSNI